MNLWPFFPRPEPHTVIRYVTATKRENAIARQKRADIRMELEFMLIHAGPEKAAKARARATDRLRKSVGAP